MNHLEWKNQWFSRAIDSFEKALIDENVARKIVHSGIRRYLSDNFNQELFINFEITMGHEFKGYWDQINDEIDIMNVDQNDAE